jgi:spore germination protein (amino acid permease)
VNRADSSTTLGRMNGLQLGAIIVGAMLGLGPLMNTRFAAVVAGRDAWIAITAAAILILIHAWLMTRIPKWYPQQTIDQILTRLSGQWIAKIVGLISVCLGLATCGITLWYTGHIMNTYILLFTPSWMISILLLLLSVYTVWFDLRVLGRVAVVIFLLAFPFKWFFFPPVLEMGNWYRLLPLAESGLQGIGYGMMMALFSFAGYELFLTFAPYVKEQKGMTKAMLTGVGYVSLMFIIGALTQQAVYPLPYLTKLWTPAIDYVSLVSIPILERTDLIFILFWFTVLYKTHVMYFYGAVLGTKEIFQLRSKMPALIGCTIVVLGLAMISLSNLEMERVLFFVMSSSIGFALFITLWITFFHWLQTKERSS